MWNVKFGIAEPFTTTFMIGAANSNGFGIKGLRNIKDILKC
jgi:hypothetical protein